MVSRKFMEAMQILNNLTLDEIDKEHLLAVEEERKKQEDKLAAIVAVLNMYWPHVITDAKGATAIVDRECPDDDSDDENTPLDDR